jgi:acetate kinase
VAVLVVPTDEELEIARQAFRCVERLGTVARS